jgi:hypothetical protein
MLNWKGKHTKKNIRVLRNTLIQSQKTHTPPQHQNIHNNKKKNKKEKQNQKKEQRRVSTVSFLFSYVLIGA